VKGKLVIASYCTGCANKNNPLEKLLYINNNSTSLSQTFAVYVRVFTQHILQISLKQLIWFKRYNSLNFKVHFFKWTCSRALNIHEHESNVAQLFVNSSNVSVMNVSCPLGV